MAAPTGLACIGAGEGCDLFKGSLQPPPMEKLFDVLTKAGKWIFGLWFLFVLGTFAISTIAAITKVHVPKDSVLHLVLDGELYDSFGDPLADMLGDKQLSLLQLTEVVRRASTDERISGLVLEIKNPQLGLSQIHLLALKLVITLGMGRQFLI